MGLKDRVAVVAASSQGMGKATAVALALDKPSAVCFTENRPSLPVGPLLNVG